MTLGSIIAWLVVGLIAGWLASIVMKTNASQGMLGDIVVGIIGAFIGGAILGFLNVGGADPNTGINLGSILTAFIGAVVLLGIMRAVRRA